MRRKITVSIVNYKTPDDTIACIKSILVHTQNVEIIVSDNNSADGSAEKIKKTFPKIKFIQNKENLGFGKAHNQVIAAAKGEYVAIVNPDILVEKDALNTLIKYLDDHEEANIVAPALYGLDHKRQPSCFAHPTLFVPFYIRRWPFKYLFKKTLARYQLEHLDLSKPQQVPWASGAFLVMRKKWYFDPSYFMYIEDADLCRRVGNIYYTPQANVIHKGGFKSRKSLKFWWIHSTNMVYYLWKFRGAPKV